MTPALSACGEIARGQDPDRYVCALFAEPPEREALFAVLAFNHEVAKTRDVISETMLGQIRLQWWREAIDGILAGTQRQHEVVQPLAEAFQRFDLDRGPFDEILDAREADLEDAPFASLEDMVAYGQATAGALGRIMLRILGDDTAPVLAAAQAASTAWALTGLLRSVPFHARVKRLMLPRDLLHRHGATIGDYNEFRDTPALRAVVQAIAMAAGDAIETARSAKGASVKRAAPVLLQARLARLYLDRLERAGFNAFDPALNADMPLKAWSLWWGRFTGRV